MATRASSPPRSRSSSGSSRGTKPRSAGRRRPAAATAAKPGIPSAVRQQPVTEPAATPFSVRSAAPRCRGRLEGACLRGGTRGATNWTCCGGSRPCVAARRNRACFCSAARSWSPPQCGGACQALSGMPSSSVSQARSAPSAT